MFAMASKCFPCILQVFQTYVIICRCKKRRFLTPTSNMCLRVGDPDGVQEEHKRFILVRAEKCTTSNEEGETCIILHRSVCGRGYKRVR
jgi:hypothetical protein